MRSTSSSVWITVLAVAAAFVAGLGAGHVAEREALAQSLDTATIYVPPGGLLFRASDGTVLARLGRDAHGGTFELLDGRRGVPAQVARSAPDGPMSAPNAYDLDGDPWTSRGAPRVDVFKDRF
jgi:hypothetical protein